MRTLPGAGCDAIGLDRLSSPFTHHVGSVSDRDFVRQCLRNVDAVVHTATLHKPHIITHTKQDFVNVNITGTLNLLEEAVAARVGALIFTSTTSTFGHALTPARGEPAAWITEDVRPQPKNIYGVSKVAAEDLCELVHRSEDLPCLILRTSRFFPEPDDRDDIRRDYEDANAKANEFLYRRADIADVVSAHICAIERAARLRFGRYIISATTPFTRGDLAELRENAPAAVKRHVPRFSEAYAKRGWSMFPSIDRVYVNERARRDLGWQPQYDFARVVDSLIANADPRSELARAVGSKGYHAASLSS